MVKMFFFLSAKPIIDFANYICGIDTIKEYKGRIQKATKETIIPWHGDNAFERKLALSINISPKEYQGAEVLCRKKDQPEKIERIKVNIGDAFLIRIDADYEHCLTPITGDNDKVHIIGWFN